jgi:hypothetical protein
MRHYFFLPLTIRANLSKIAMFYFTILGSHLAEGELLIICHFEPGFTSSPTGASLRVVGKNSDREIPLSYSEHADCSSLHTT